MTKNFLLESRFKINFSNGCYTRFIYTYIIIDVAQDDTYNTSIVLFDYNEKKKEISFSQEKTLEERNKKLYDYLTN